MTREAPCDDEAAHAILALFALVHFASFFSRALGLASQHRTLALALRKSPSQNMIAHNSRVFSIGRQSLLSSSALDSLQIAGACQQAPFSLRVRQIAISRF